MNVLEASEITVRFGGVVAVDGVSLTVAPGEMLGLMGPNGSGKTSLLDAISGFETYVGSVRLSGKSVDSASAYQRARRGIARTFQGLELFDDLTVAENIGITRRSDEDVDAALAAVGASGLKLTRIADLGNGERRFIALARALAGRPRVVLVDEVAAGLDADAQARIAQCLRVAASNGAGVVLVDHNLDFVGEVADRVIVLDHGNAISSGSPSQIRNDARVVAAYLGATA